MANSRYYIFEHEVDKGTFDKYKNRTYEIGGVKRNLLGVGVWATSSEIAEACPEEAAQAKRSYNQILSEIGAQSKAPAKHKTFHTFLEDLQRAYREELANYDAVHNAWDIAQKEYNAAMADSLAPDYMKVIARGDYERAKQTFERDKLAALENYKVKAKEIRKSMEAFVADVYRVAPDRIDQNAMQLLNAGIMTVDEAEHLAMQYANNPTMMRLIGQYAKKNFDASKNSFGKVSDVGYKWKRLGGTLESAADSSKAFGGFDSLAEYAEGALGCCRNSTRADFAIARSRQKRWEDTYNQAVAVYDNFIVQPSGGSEA